MTGNGPDVLSQTSADDTWRFLLARTSIYAANHVSRWLWRGSPGGVLPDGYDPDTIASQAITDYFIKAGLPRQGQMTADQGQQTTDLIQRLLERRVRLIVNRLHHRIENRLFRNEPDLAPVTLDDGESVSVIDLIPDPSARPDRVLVDKENSVQFLIFKVQFSAFLARDRRVLKLFQLYCQGCSRPEEIAAKMKLHPSKVLNLQKRFFRKWAEFHVPLISPQSRNKNENILSKQPSDYQSLTTVR